MTHAIELKQQWAERIAQMESAYRQGLSGENLTQQWTQQMDELVNRAYRQAVREALGDPKAQPGSLALIALGGFGRRQLCPHSDVDLMFLYRERGSGPVEKIIKTTFHQLWDMGLEIGHSARTLKDSIALAQNDFTSLTSMLEGRYLDGDRHLFQIFQQSLLSHILKTGKASFIEAKAEERRRRIERFGDTVCIQEPNLKEGIGALRDLHHGLWIGLMLVGAKDLEGLQTSRIITPSETALMRQAIDAILRLRFGLHFLTGKREDHLSFARQEALAKSLGFEDTPTELAEAAMLRQYYTHALVLKRFAEGMSAKAQAQNPPSQSLFSFALRRREKPVELMPPFALRHGEITFREFQPRPEAIRDYFAEDRSRFLTLIKYLLDYSVQWSSAVCLAIEASRDLIESHYIEQPEVGQWLRGLFRRPRDVGRVLFAMRDTDLLSCYFPELKKIRFLVRHDFYHRYTVDEHSIRCVEVLDRLSAITAREEISDRFNEESLAWLWQRMEHPEVLRVAALFHDAGKGYGKGHSERGMEVVQPVLQRLGMTPEQGEEVNFLILQHLLMSETAFRRDIDDFKTIEEFAQKVSTPERLDQLLILTYVDISSVSTGMMTPWKAGLLWQLYLRCRRILLGEKTAVSPDIQESRQSVFNVLAAHYSRELIAEHLDQLPVQYTLYTTPGLIGRHLSVLNQYDRQKAQVQTRFLALHEMEDEQGRKRPEETIEAIICTRDRLGLFRDIARSFHLENFHIISARLFTRSDGTVIDTVVGVNALPDSPVGAGRLQILIERLQRMVPPNGVTADYQLRPLPERRELSSADLGRTVFRTELKFLNNASASYSLIEVQAMDHPALLETLAACLTEKGVDIRFARLQKQGIRVVHAFYVTDSAGGKITDPERMQEIQSFVLQYLDTRTVEV